MKHTKGSTRNQVGTERFFGRCLKENLLDAEFRRMLSKLQEERRRLQTEIRERTAGYVIAALSLVVGLAWNDAVKALIEYLLPFGRETLLAKFGYALLITLVIILLSTSVLRLLTKTKEEEKKG